jgi:protein ImuA
MSFSHVTRHDFPEEVPRPGRLAALRERIRHIEQPASHGVLPFGVAAIDRALPGGGLALGAVHEILGIGGDEEDGAAACGFIAGLLARLRRGPVLWCLKRPDLYGPGLLAHGLDPARLVIATAPRDEDILWAIEEGLRAPGLAAVVGEIGRLPLVAGRRLQLAAERSGITAFLLRRWRNSEDASRERERPSAAVTRWRIAALPARDIDDPRLRQLIGQPRWRVELLRCRGGVPAQWVVESGDMEVADATGHVRLSPELADRPAAAVDRKEGRLAAEPLQRRTG